MMKLETVFYLGQKTLFCMGYALSEEMKKIYQIKFGPKRKYVTVAA